MATFMPKNGNRLLSIFFAQFRPIWNNLSSVTKNDNVGHFSHSVFITELEFLVKNDFQSKMYNLKICHFLSWSISRWIFKFYIFDQKPFLTKNSNSVIKTEWEKYPLHWNWSKSGNFRQFPDFPISRFQKITDVAKSVQNYREYVVLIVSANI